MRGLDLPPRCRAGSHRERLLLLLVKSSGLQPVTSRDITFGQHARKCLAQEARQAERAVEPGVARFADRGFVQFMLLALQAEAQGIDVPGDLAEVGAGLQLVLKQPENFLNLVLDRVGPACPLLEAL